MLHDALEAIQALPIRNVSFCRKTLGTDHELAAKDDSIVRFCRPRVFLVVECSLDYLRIECAVFLQITHFADVLEISL